MTPDQIGDSAHPMFSLPQMDGLDSSQKRMV
jgi:hypothetical protein